MIEMQSARPRPQTAPCVEAFQKIEKMMTGRFALAATGNAEADEEGNVHSCGPSTIAMRMASAPTDERR
jgi:hypothetical protein